MKILIVGAGIGGLTLGAFLRKLEIEFDIVDKSKDWNRQGYSLGLWNNGREILKKLGLEEKFDKSGEQIRNFIICDGAGKVLKNHNLIDFYTSYGCAYTHLDRVDLHSWLLDLVGREKIKMDTQISSTEEMNGCDLVVGADGIHSQVRNFIFGDKDYEHYSMWRLWLVRVDNKFKKEKAVIQYVEPGQFFSLFDDKEKTLAVFIAPAKHEEWDEEKGRVDRLKNIFYKIPVAQKVLEGISDSDITPTDLSFITMKKWSKGNVVLLGDSAHAMEPFAGLGASMAMEDAYVLSGEIFQVKEGKKSISDALNYYEEKRKHRVRMAKKATENMRWWAMYKSTIFQKIINLFAPIVPVKYFTRDFSKILKEEI